jgi:hypothetical protein
VVNGQEAVAFLLSLGKATMLTYFISPSPSDFISRLLFMPSHVQLKLSQLGRLVLRPFLSHTITLFDTPFCPPTQATAWMHDRMPLFWLHGRKNLHAPGCLLRWLGRSSLILRRGYGAFVRIRTSLSLRLLSEPSYDDG